MRRTPVLRLLISCGLMALFAATSLVHARSAAVPSAANSLRPLGAGSPSINPQVATNSGSPATPGSSATYVFTLTNNGPTNDTFALTFANPSGSNSPLLYSILGNSNPALNNAASVQFTVLVQIPAGTPPGAYDKLLVATSTTGGGASQSLITTVVVAPSPTATLAPTLTTTPSPTITPSPTTTSTPTGTAGPLCRDGFEPNNDPGQAHEIKINVPQSHAICPNGDEDWSFFGGLAGKVYTVDIPEMANGLDMSLGIYDEDGNLLAFNDDFPRNNDPRDLKPRIQSWRAVTNGRYYIRARDAAGGGGAGLTYTLSLLDESYGPTPTQIAELCNDLFEPDGLPEQARLMVIREVQPNHKFCPTGDADWVRVFMKVGAGYVLRTDSHSLPGADPVLVLVDRDGISILDIQDDTGNTLDARIEFSPPVDGYYYVQAKNVGDVGNQFIAYDLFFEQPGISNGATPTPTVNAVSTVTPPATATATTTAGSRTATPTITGTPPTTTSTTSAYPPPTSTATATATATPVVRPAGGGRLKGGPPLIDRPAADFVDPAFKSVWSRTDQPVASQRASRTWMWGPAGLVARTELYHQSNGGVRQVQYFDKARMEISDWQRDRANPWFVTNGLLVQELIDGRMQLGDQEFARSAPATINIAGDEGDAQAPTYAAFRGLLGRVADLTGTTATATLRRDGSTGSAAPDSAALLAHYVGETGHNIPAVFWSFLNARGPVGDGGREDTLVDWVFAMGYPISEPYWATVRVGGVERQVLVQAFQRRVLTFTPTNPAGWQVEMGNVGRHYYQWRYHVNP